MKKLFKVLVVVLLVIVLLAAVLLFIIAKRQNAPGKYWESISTEGAIENRYNSLGEYETAKKTYDAPKDERDPGANHFVVWYPEKKGKYPLVVMINGSGTPCSKYEAVFEHFASWGYVVIGNDYGTNWDGKHASETLDFALNTEEIAGMTDTGKIAVGGHSQGGTGTFNAITEYENGSLYKAAFALSPTNNDLALGLQWGFDLDTADPYAFRLEEIQIPMLIAAGTGPFDHDTVSPLAEMQEEYAALNFDKVMFRRADEIDHGDILYDVNGYVIAWLDLYLKGMKGNKSAFFGDNAEIRNNMRYQDFNSQKVAE